MEHPSATVRAATELEVLSIHRSYISPIFSYLPSWQEKVREEYAQRTAMNREAEEARYMGEGKDHGG